MSYRQILVRGFDRDMPAKTLITGYNSGILKYGQQKNIELQTFSCNLGSSGTGGPPTEVKLPWLEDVSEESSNFMNSETCVAARWA